jgi:hypothetical protein
MTSRTRPADTEAAYAAYLAATAAFDLHKTPETLAAVKATWAVYDALTPRRPGARYASRAGQRQRAELLAQTRGRRS